MKYYNTKPEPAETLFYEMINLLLWKYTEIKACPQRVMNDYCHE